MFFFKKKNKKYLSCELIEHGMDFGVNSINLCCRMFRPNDNFYRIIDDFHGELFDWKDYFREKRKYRNMMKKGKMLPECVGCGFLEEKEWDDEDYIAHINFNHGINCNQSCVYCRIHVLNIGKKQYNSFPVIKDMIERGYLRGDTNITIAGGEPCISPEFTDLLDIFIKHKISPVRILTNASVYNKSLEEAIRQGGTYIEVSPDSGFKETFQKIKKADFFEQVWENIGKYASAQPYPDRVISKFIIIPDYNDRTEEIDEWINKSVSCGVGHLSVDVEMSYYEHNKDNMPQSIIDLVGYAIKQIQGKNLKLELLNRSKTIAQEHNFI